MVLDIRRLHPQIVVLPGLLPPERCVQLIERGQAQGYEEAPVTTKSGPVMRKDLRNNTRAILFDQVLADELYELVKPAPLEVVGWEPCGLNDMFRFYRYTEGQVFNWHRDGHYERPDGQCPEQAHLHDLPRRGMQRWGDGIQ